MADIDENLLRKIVKEVLSETNQIVLRLTLIKVMIVLQQQLKRYNNQIDKADSRKET